MTACRTIALLALLLACPTAGAELLLDLVPPSGQLVANEGQTVQFIVTDTTGAPINAVLLNITDAGGQLLFNNTYTNILGGNTLSGSFPAAVPGTLTLEFIVVQGVSGVTIVVDYVVIEGEPLPDGLLGLSPSTIQPDRTSMVSVTAPEGIDSTGAVFHLSGGASIASVQQLSATVFVIDIAAGGPDILRLTLERSGAVLASGVLFVAEQDPFEAIDALAAVAGGFQPGDNLLRGLRDNLAAAAEAIRTGEMQDATGALASSVGLLDNLARQLQFRGLAGGTTGSTISILREWLIRLPQQKRPLDIRLPEVPGPAPCTVELVLIEHDVAGGGGSQARLRQITRAGLKVPARLDEDGLRVLRAALAGDNEARKAIEKTAKSTRFNPGAGELIVFPGARAVPSAPTGPINNVVLVVFKVTPPGGTVFFRLIDPDDPEKSDLIDTNGDLGDDNRGFFDSNAGGGFLKVNLESRATLPLERVFLLPGVEFRYGIRPPGQGGFRGLWRPFPSPPLTHFRAFPSGGIAELSSDPTTGLAAMELALSFAPGDDFRFVADCQKPKIGTGLEQINKSPLITVWRMLHIERDRLESLVEARQRLATGSPADAVRTAGLNQVSTARAIAMADVGASRQLTVQATGGRDRFWLDGRFTFGRLRHISKFAASGEMQFPRGSLLFNRSDRLSWASSRRGQQTGGATATFSFGRIRFAGRLSFQRRGDMELAISSFGTRGSGAAVVHFAGFSDEIGAQLDALRAAGPKTLRLAGSSFAVVSLEATEVRLALAPFATITSIRDDDDRTLAAERMAEEALLPGGQPNLDRARILPVFRTMLQHNDVLPYMEWFHNEQREEERTLPIDNASGAARLVDFAQSLVVRTGSDEDLRRSHNRAGQISRPAFWAVHTLGVYQGNFLGDRDPARPRLAGVPRKNLPPWVLGRTMSNHPFFTLPAAGQGMIRVLSITPAAGPDRLFTVQVNGLMLVRAIAQHMHPPTFVPLIAEGPGYLITGWQSLDSQSNQIVFLGTRIDQTVPDVAAGTTISLRVRPVLTAASHFEVNRDRYARGYRAQAQRTFAHELSHLLASTHHDGGFAADQGQQFSVRSIRTFRLTSFP